MKKIEISFKQYAFSKLQSLIPWPKPLVLSGAGSISKLPRQVKDDGIRKVCIVTTAGFIKRRTLNSLLDEFEIEKVAYIIFDGVQPDPSIECIEAAADLYRKESCEAIIAVGGRFCD